jgi:2-polyprenyl-3-methyl-5-hydroxy-6-metoxy-1,4-benzoquinol methylase
MTTVADTHTATGTIRRADCLICGSWRWVAAIDNAPALRRCCRCGFVERSSLPAGEWKNLYEGDYYPRYFEHAEQWRFEARRRLAWIRKAHAPHRLLEIGSGGGFFVEVARRSGIDAHGVELSDIAAGHARDVLKVPVTTGDFQTAELAGPYDAVVAFHVLEHIPDPCVFLQQAHDLLVPGGLLAIEVPNIESVGARAEGLSWRPLLPDHHLSHFAPTTLLRLVTSVGLEPLSCQTVFEHHYIPPSRRLRRASFAQLYRTMRQTGSPWSVHHDLGDHVRLLARRP